MKNIYQKLDKHRIIQTKRLLLRPVTLTDAQAMYSYASDEENIRWTFPPNRSLEETENIIASIYLASPLGRWGIELTSSNEFIGTIDLMNINEELGTATVGYTLNKKYWNQGYASEVLVAIIKLFFERLEMNCLIAEHVKENLASGRVMQKSGMTLIAEEPYSKKDWKNPNLFMSVKRYAITKEHYFKEKNK